MIEVVKAWGWLRSDDSGELAAAALSTRPGHFVNRVQVVIMRESDWQAREAEREKMLKLLREALGVANAYGFDVLAGEIQEIVGGR